MTPKITLYTFAPSQNAVRAEIALHEKALPFEKVAVDLFAGAGQKPPLIDLNPRGQIPTLVYGEGAEAIAVYESIAIVRFLEDMHPEPALLPPVDEPARRARALIRIEEFQAKLDVRNIFGSVVFRKQGREALGARLDDLHNEIPRWDAYLEGETFLAGEQFTLADIAVFPLLMHFEVLGYPFREKTPALHAYIERCKVRPSIVATGWVPTFLAFASKLEPARVLGE